MKKTLITFFSILFIFLNQPTFAEKHLKGTRFVVAGHLYPIIKDVQKINEFVLKINSYKPDYVFLLGDSNLQDEKSFNYLQTTISSKIFYVPGNNELRISKDGYIKNVGYLNKVIIEKDIKFILLDSSDSLDNIKKFLNENLIKPFNYGPTIILTHHRIWDDTIISKKPYQHDKSYYFEDIYPSIKNKIHSIFSGNSKRQYFRDLNDHGGYGKQNVNLIYWMDKIGSIGLYSIGMGDGRPKATFTIVDIVDDKIIVNGDFSSTDEYDILPKNLIVFNEEKIDKNNIRRIREIVKDRYLLINKKKLQIALTVLFILILILIFYKKLKKSYFPRK
jgi:hypothetical protein